MQAELGDFPQVGARLAQARQKCGLSISDVADRTKVASHYLRAIESDAFGQLPSRIHAIGFARSFARCVRLDAEEVGCAMGRTLEANGAFRSAAREAGCREAAAARPDQLSRLYRNVKERLFA